MIKKSKKDNQKDMPDSEGTLERFVNSQPIIAMLNMLAQTGRESFKETSSWEVCLCVLILKLEPNCKVKRVLEALPHDKSAMDQADFLNTMAHLGYYCRPADSSLKEIDARLLPGVFIPSQGEPCIVLWRDELDDLQFYDPISKLISDVPPSFDKYGKVWFF